jgi:two-component system, sensor histidine kinase
MPNMKGFEATKKLHNTGFKKPIIAMTASLMNEDEQKCREAGCDDFITKPINCGQLVKLLGKYMSPAEAVHTG